jgi:hypothetical protein
VMNAPYFTIQCALLYSTSYGERRIRVHTIQVCMFYVNVFSQKLDIRFSKKGDGRTRVCFHCAHFRS